MEIDYTPSKVCKEFMQSDAKMRVLMGPVGSGKSVASCFEVIRRATMQKPNKQKKILEEIILLRKFGNGKNILVIILLIN